MSKHVVSGFVVLLELGSGFPFGVDAEDDPVRVLHSSCDAGKKREKVPGKRGLARIP